MLTHRNIVSNVGATRTILAIAPGGPAAVHPAARPHLRVHASASCRPPAGRRGHVPRPAADRARPAARPSPAVRPTIMLTVPLVMEKIYRSKVLPELQRHALYARPLLRRLLNRVAGRKLRTLFGGRLRFFGIGGRRPRARRRAFPRRGAIPLRHRLRPDRDRAPGRRLRAVPDPCSARRGPALPGVEVRIADAGPRRRVRSRCAGPTSCRATTAIPNARPRSSPTTGGSAPATSDSSTARGRLSIRGRLKTMILGASGENIYPEEIEAVINQSEYGRGVARVRRHIGRDRPRAAQARGAGVSVRQRPGRHREGRGAINGLLESIRREVNASWRASASPARGAAAEPVREDPHAEDQAPRLSPAHVLIAGGAAAGAGAASQGALPRGLCPLTPRRMRTILFIERVDGDE